MSRFANRVKRVERVRRERPVRGVLVTGEKEFSQRHAAVRLHGWERVRGQLLLCDQGLRMPTWRHERQRAGMRLRALREAPRYGQLKLAATSGLTHEAISRLE